MALSVQEIIRSVEQLPLAQREVVIQSRTQGMRNQERVQSMAAIKRKYPREWLAVNIPEDENEYDPRRGLLIAHSTDRAMVWEQVEMLSSAEYVFVFFNGTTGVKGFGMAFHDTDSPASDVEST